MKTIKFLNLLLIPLFGMISFAACSSDDDDPEQGSDDPKPEELKLKTFEENVNGVAFTMIAVPGGSFNMGTNEDFKQGSQNNDDEKPAHKVTLDSYYIGETEVTQAERDIQTVCSIHRKTVETHWKSLHFAYRSSMGICCQGWSEIQGISLFGKQFITRILVL